MAKKSKNKQRKLQTKRMREAVEKICPDVYKMVETCFEDSFVCFMNAKYNMDSGMLTLTYKFRDEYFKLSIDVCIFEYCFIGETFELERFLKDIKLHIKKLISDRIGQINKKHFDKDSEIIRNELLYKIIQQSPWILNKKGTLIIGEYSTRINVKNLFQKHDIISVKQKDKYGFSITKAKLCCNENDFIKQFFSEMENQIKDNDIELLGYTPPKKAKQQLNDLFCAYSDSVSPFLRGKQKIKISIGKIAFYCKNCDLTNVYGNCEHFEFRIYNDEIIDLKYKGKFKAFMETVDDPIYKKAESYILSEIENFTYKLEYRDGNGLLIDGNVHVTAWDESHISKTTVLLTCPDIRTKEWEVSFIESLTNARRTIETFFKQEEEMIEKRFKKIRYSILAKAILQVVEANKDFITENGIVAVLRGTKPTYEVSTSNCEYIGKFNYLTADEVKSMIYKLVNVDILGLKNVRSEYHTYYDVILLKTGKTQKFFKGIVESVSMVKGKANSGQILNFFEAELYFKSLNQDSLSTSDYIEALHLIKTHEFICIYENEYVEMFKNAPKEFKMYVKMIRENTEDRRLRKIYKKIIDVVGKE